MKIFKNWRNRLRFYLFGTVMRKPTRKQRRMHEMGMNRIKEMRRRARVFEPDIYEMFFTRREVSRSELLDKIKCKYDTDDVQNRQILDQWIKLNMLIPCMWNQDKLEFFTLLGSNWDVISEDDLNHKKWLEQHGLTRDPMSDEELRFRQNWDNTDTLF